MKDRDSTTRLIQIEVERFRVNGKDVYLIFSLLVGYHNSTTNLIKYIILIHESRQGLFPCVSCSPPKRKSILVLGSIVGEKSFFLD